MKIQKILILTLIILSFSCTKQEKQLPQKITNEKNQTKAKKLQIGFSIDTLAIERWQRDLDIFMNKAHELGADVIVQNAVNNAEEQNRQLLYLLEKQVDTIIIVAKEAKSLTDTIHKIKNKNIPIIAIHIEFPIPL